MKLSINDLKLVMQWLEANSNDVTVQVGMDLSEFRVVTTDRGNQICTIYLYPADGSTRARIVSSDYLDTRVPKKLTGR